jgi:tRNA(Ile)-lysidine synthase TilS/MesJ
MDGVRNALLETADKGLMPRGASILLAVSGSADSTALLHAAAELRKYLARLAEAEDDLRERIVRIRRRPRKAGKRL